MPDDAKIQFCVSTLHDGRVLIDFLTHMCDHLKMEQDEALDFAEALVEAVTQARKFGREILTLGGPVANDPRNG